VSSAIGVPLSTWLGGGGSDGATVVSFDDSIEGGSAIIVSCPTNGGHRRRSGGGLRTRSAVLYLIPCTCHTCMETARTSVASRKQVG
jgi:hypothetical protein